VVVAIGENEDNEEEVTCLCSGWRLEENEWEGHCEDRGSEWYACYSLVVDVEVTKKGSTLGKRTRCLPVFTTSSSS
jgi:hypothetical protein